MNRPLNVMPPRIVTTLDPHQVFCFGTNQHGFHGAGAAWLAWAGPEKQHLSWRSDPDFAAAQQSPAHSPLRTGHWAVLGVARGPMQGHCGQSYGVQTVTNPGQRQSVSLAEIGKQLTELAQFAAESPAQEFLITRLGTGYGGYRWAQILHLYRSIEWPENCTFL